MSGVDSIVGEELLRRILDAQKVLDVVDMGLIGICRCLQIAGHEGVEKGPVFLENF